MLFLFLAICCSSSIALLFRHSESRDMNRYVVTAANYVTAAVIATLFALTRPPQLETGRAYENSTAALRRIVNGIFNNQVETFGSEWAVLIGLIAGPVFILAFIFYQKSIRQNAVGLTGAIAKLGILLPMSLSLVLWREQPTLLQWIGMSLAVLSLLVAYLPRAAGREARSRLLLVLLFLFGGLAEFSNKVFQKYGSLDDRALFLAVTFATALVVGVVVVAARRMRVRGRDVAVGLMIGIPNLFSSYFLIMALDSIPAAVAFAAFGAGTIVVINVGGMILFGERLARHEWTAVGLTIVALLLMYLPS